MKNEHQRVVIRRGLPTDLDTVVAITDAAYTHYIPLLGRKPRPMLTDYRPLIAANEVWLLELESQPIGVLVLTHNPDHLLIYNVAVSPHYQKRGFGRQLLDWGEQQAKHDGYKTIRLYTNLLMVENIALYKRLGYVEGEHEPLMGSTVVHMAKRL
jgi:ribosomal protein S18 acetylase RimI-like enzyme